MADGGPPHVGHGTRIEAFVYKARRHGERSAVANPRNT